LIFNVDIDMLLIGWRREHIRRLEVKRLHYSLGQVLYWPLRGLKIGNHCTARTLTVHEDRLTSAACKLTGKVGWRTAVKVVVTIGWLQATLRVDSEDLLGRWKLFFEPPHLGIGCRYLFTQDLSWFYLLRQRWRTVVFEYYRAQSLCFECLLF